MPGYSPRHTAVSPTHLAGGNFGYSFVVQVGASMAPVIAILLRPAYGRRTWQRSILASYMRTSWMIQTMDTATASAEQKPDRVKIWFRFRPREFFAAAGGDMV
jgi:hypothetical protein